MQILLLSTDLHPRQRRWFCGLSVCKMHIMSRLASGDIQYLYSLYLMKTKSESLSYRVASSDRFLLVSTYCTIVKASNIPDLFHVILYFPIRQSLLQHVV